MMNTVEFENIFESIYDGSPISIELALLKIKEHGATQMQSTLVLIRKLKLSISGADSLIMNSDVWKYNRDNVIKVRNEFGDVIEGFDEE